MTVAGTPVPIPHKFPMSDVSPYSSVDLRRNRSQGGAPGLRYGSAEQGMHDDVGRPVNFKTHESPRTPRHARSPGDREDRERDRKDWRQPREQPAEEPFGFGFRLGALEQSLRQHYQEIEAQRALLADLKPKVEGLMTHKIDLETRLDKTFNDMKSKVAELDKSHSLAREAMRAEC